MRSDRYRCDTYIFLQQQGDFWSIKSDRCISPIIDSIKEKYKWSDTCQDSVPVAIRCVLEADNYIEFIKDLVNEKMFFENNIIMKGKKIFILQ